MTYKVNIINYRNMEGISIFPCDRTTPVGNPYYMVNESMRNEVCDKYEVYFKRKVTENNLFSRYMFRMLDYLLEHKEITLGCWCTPKRCHCETIKAWLLEQAEKEFSNELAKEL